MASQPPTHRPPVNFASLGERFQEVARTLNTHFLDKQEIVRLLMVSSIAGEHMVLVGPPGTAKSAMVRSSSRPSKSASA